jgi:hypothetical protein
LGGLEMGLNELAMRIARPHVKDLKNRKRCLFLGDQEVYMTLEQALSIFHDSGKKVPDNVSKNIERMGNEKIYSAVERNRIKYFLSCHLLGHVMGFLESHTVDYAELSLKSPRVDFLHDLNVPGLQEVSGGEYDMIFDGGTLEHIFHIPAAMKNLVDSLSVGGKIMHIVPTNNNINHGFYQFSPTIFDSFYKTNNMIIKHASILKHKEKGELTLCSPKGTEYLSEFYDSKDPINLIFIAEKTNDSTSDRIPQQQHYKELWEKASKIRIMKMQ